MSILFEIFKLLPKFRNDFKIFIKSLKNLKKNMLHGKKVKILIKNQNGEYIFSYFREKSY